MTDTAPAPSPAPLRIAPVRLRVSTDEQDLARQEAIVAGARAAGCHVAAVHRGAASGARPDWPELLRMVQHLQPGEVVAERIDHIGRLRLKATSFPRSVRSSAWDSGPSEMPMLAEVAKVEVGRVREGLTAVRARDRKGGLPGVMAPEKLRYARYLMADPNRSILSICQELGGFRLSTLTTTCTPMGP